MGSPQMLPLLFGIVVKRHHPIPVLVDQISRCLQSSLATPMLESSFDSLGFLPCFCIRDLPQHQQGRFVSTLGILASKLTMRLIPASLFVGFWEDVAQHSPDPQMPVSDHQTGWVHPPLFEIPQHFDSSGSILDNHY